MGFIINRKKKPHSFYNLRNNIYNQRVDNNLSKQFKEVHNPIEKTEYINDTITDEQGLDKAYDHGDYYIHGSVLYIAGSITKKGLVR